MENAKSLLESCAELTMEDLVDLTFTKILEGKEEEARFIGLGIMDKNGYLLDYDDIKKINAGLNYFIRNVNPELIKKMNAQKMREDIIQRQKDELIELVSKNIVDKEELEDDDYEEYGFLYFIRDLFKKGKD